MTLYYNNKKVSALHKVYLGDKLVFEGGATPSSASACLVYNEASPSKLTLKAGTVRTYDEGKAELQPNGLCGIISFDSEMNIKNVT